VQFLMLGPLEVVVDSRPVPLGGLRSRTTLGFLLMHANRAVATSRLLDVLWPGDRAPDSSRQILQNAIWGLRRTLASAAPAGQPVALRTQAPGYMLQAETDQIDLLQFHAAVEAGRAELLLGSPQDAARTLHRALDLWRGSALADLVEVGVQWPELATLETTRLGAMEDLFEAELASGRHHAVLADLEVMVRSEPLRERPCSQLMIALYRSGRHADALALYANLRTVLGDDLGLEPSRELQLLQRAILNHDPTLMCSADADPGTRERLPDLGPVLPAKPTSSRRLVSVHAPAEDSVIHLAPKPALQQDDRATSPIGPLPDISAERKRLSIVLVRTRLRMAPSGDEVDQLLSMALAEIKNKSEMHGGLLMASTGPVTMVIFGADGWKSDDVERAGRAALDIGSLFSPVSAGQLSQSMEARVVAVTGDVLVGHRFDPAKPDISVTGLLLEDSMSLLEQMLPGEIIIGGENRRGTPGVLESLRE